MKNTEATKYKEALICDKPDIQSNNPSFGVEVVTANFLELKKWSTLVGIDLLAFLKREKASKILRKNINYMFNEHFPDQYIKDFLSNKIYIECNKKAMQIKTKEQLQKLEMNKVLYLGHTVRWIYTVNESGIVNYIVSPAQWTSNFPSMLSNIFKDKSNKWIYVNKVDINKFYINNSN